MTEAVANYYYGYQPAVAKKVRLLRIHRDARIARHVSPRYKTRGRPNHALSKASSTPSRVFISSAQVCKAL
jgi:hypothetical protein